VPAFRCLATPLALVASLVASASMAQDTVPKSTDKLASFGQVEGWNVYVNETRKNCFGERVREDSVLQMGSTDETGVGYLGVFTKAPTGAENEKIRDIAIDVNGTRYAGEAAEMAGNLKAGYSGGYILSKDPGFIQAVADQPSMKVIIAGRDPVDLDLGGTRKAIEMIRDCNARQAG
jgi:hypothetical protein